MKTNEEKFLVNIFRDFIRLEDEIEQQKILLSFKADFNLVDAFALFDLNGTGTVSIKDLHEGLIAIGVNVEPSMSDLYLLANRYASDVKNGFFTANDFKSLFLPVH